MVSWLISIGMSEARAQDEANRAAPRYENIVREENNDRQIQLDFFSMPRAKMAKEQGCHRSTIYRRRDKVVAFMRSLATSAQVG